MKNPWKQNVTIALLSAVISLSGPALFGMAFAGGSSDSSKCEESNGTMNDTTNSLMLQSATVDSKDWNEASSYAASLSLDGKTGWRLPTIEELRKLYNSECKTSVVMYNGPYWSATPGATADTARTLNFDNGVEEDAKKTQPYNMRAVR